MARIRSIHPGLWTDEAFASLPDGAALLYIGLLNESDDNGVFEWKTVTIKMRLRPASSLSPAEIEATLMTIEAAGMVRRFEVDGRKYGAVRNFVKWQRPKSPKSVHPVPEDVRNYLGFTDDGNRPRAGTGRPPDDDSSEDVRNEFGTTSEIVCQRKEEGGKRKEEGGRESHARAPVDASHPEAAGPIPMDWQAEADDWKAALAAGLAPKDIPAEAARFRDHNIAKGTVTANIGALWRVWLSRVADFGKAKAPPPDDAPAIWMTWVGEDDPLWPTAAARHLSEKGKALFPTTSKHASGFGAFVPSDWIEKAAA